MKDQNDNNLCKEIGAKIKYHRIKLDMSQEQLAAKVGLTTNYLSYLERGDRLPSLTAVLKIIDALGVTPNHILGNVVDTAFPIHADKLSKVVNELPVEVQMELFDTINSTVAAIFKPKNK